MTDASPDWDELRRLATDLAAIEPRYRSSRATLMAHYSNATEPEHILALLDRAEKAEAEAARLREALDTIAGFAKIDMRGCYERELRDIIRSMTDRARALTGGDHG